MRMQQMQSACPSALMCISVALHEHWLGLQAPEAEPMTEDEELAMALAMSC